MSKINKDVLIVEDQLFFQEILEISLKKVVPPTTTIKKVSSGNQAIDLLRIERDSIGLILLDMKMEDGDGLAVLNYLDENDFPKIPIYIVSALDTKFISFVMQSIGDLEVRLVGFLPKETPDSVIARIKNFKTDIESFLTEEVKVDDDEIEQINSSVNCSNIMQLLESELRFYIQPKISPENNGYITSYEVLSRLYDENLGILTPSLFFPFLDTLDKKSKFQWLVIDKTFEFQSLNMNLGVYSSFSINIDCEIFARDDFVDKFELIASDYDIDLSLITLEITRLDASLQDNLAINIKRLQLLGVQISLDNFSGAVDDLENLIGVEFDEVKLDMRSYEGVFGHGVEKQSFMLLYSYLHKKQCRIVAESVEDEETSNFLKKLDGIEVQGYYYAMPKPISEIDEFFSDIFKSRVSYLLSDMGKESFIEIYDYFYTTTLTSIDHYLEPNCDITLKDFVHQQKGALKTAGLYEGLKFIDMYSETKDTKYLLRLKEYLTYFDNVLLGSIF
ncbi:EAL domain-containing protein [Vibrio sp. TH_r3]|uniref:EAL domain-containing response regulator n=1 Tax=Vibrio sp. TH_r3 TaxID=3082084 RepID=UPI0029541CD2|nr:EAL domain-containing protein [Vibrio sp. TH_r3]MDV7103412.1 EAL domain-containing protein [Vibrio sp. TH_r3]